MAPVVGDVGDAVGDDGGELDERAEAARPDDLERRPQLDLGMGLRAALVGAVHRPLELRPEEAHGDAPPLLEGRAHDPRGIPRLGDANRKRGAALDRQVGATSLVRVIAPHADDDAGAAHAPVRISVDHRDDHARDPRPRPGRQRRLPPLRRVGRGREAGRGRGRGGLLRVAAARRCQAHEGQPCRDEANHASPGSPATGSGSSSANGTRLPPSSAVSTNARRSASSGPRRGSRRASAPVVRPRPAPAPAQGSATLTRAAAEKPPNRGFTSVTGSEPSGSRKHWTLAGPTIPTVSATRHACSISSVSLIEAPLIDSPPLDWIIVRGIACRQMLSRSQKTSTENSSPWQSSCTKSRRSCSRGRSRARRGRARGRCAASRSPRAP